MIIVFDYIRPVFDRNLIVFELFISDSLTIIPIYWSDAVHQSDLTLKPKGSDFKS